MYQQTIISKCQHTITDIYLLYKQYTNVIKYQKTCQHTLMYVDILYKKVIIIIKCEHTIIIKYHHTSTKVYIIHKLI